jgi:hypothetical protein
MGRWIVLKDIDLSSDAESTLDKIYDEVDDLLYANQFYDLSFFLRRIDCSKCSIDVLLALLTTTAPAKSHLLNRPFFYENVCKELENRGINEDGLLDGLK